MFIALVTAYIIFLVVLVIRKSQKVKNESDFVVAGQNVSVFTLVATLVCTWIGSGSLFGSAGLAFQTGLSQLWFSAGAWIGIAAIYFIASKFRESNDFTLTDLLESKYGKYSKYAGTFIVILSYTIIAGYQFKGGGRLINIISDGAIPIETGILISCVTIIIFTALAGMVSVVSIDLFNGIIMTLAVLASCIYLYTTKGDLILDNISTHYPEHLSVFGGHSFTWVIGVMLPTLLLLLTESSVYQKFSSAKDGKAAKQAVVGMLIGVISIEVLMSIVALGGFGIYMHDSRFLLTDGTINNQMAEEIILRIGFEQTPLLLGSLIFSAGVAIILSTGNTFLLVASTNVSRDIVGLKRMEDSRLSQVQWQRIIIVGLGIIAYLIMTQFQTILEMAMLSYTMIGASIAPSLIASFLFKKVSPKAGFASILSGMITVVGIFILNKNAASLNNEFMGFELPIEVDYVAIPALLISVSVFCIGHLPLLRKTK